MILGGRDSGLGQLKEALGQLGQPGEPRPARNAEKEVVKPCTIT